MDARVDEFRAGLLGAPVSYREATERPVASRFGRELSRVLVAERAAGWEWVVAIGALFVFGRSNVLFFRQRLAGLFGGRAGALWQEDVALQSVFAVASVVVLAVAVRRASPSALLRQPILLAFTAMAWLSIMWSIEPQTTVRRALLFAGTVVVGWYVGDRFSFAGQLRIVVGVAMLAVVGSAIALVFWTDPATTTNGNPGQWSGIYVNRNLLGSVLSSGLLAMVFVLPSSSRRWPLYAVGAIFAALLVLTGSRTGPVALGGALAVAFCVWLFRRQTSRRLSAAAGAYITFASLGTIGLIVHWYWIEILQWLGRDPSLTKRRWIWEVDRWFAGHQPWTGWGFEALWTNPKAIDQAYGATGKYPYTAHNGYYEVQIGLGRIGLVLFVAFLAFAAWQAFRYAWRRTDVTSVWPLTFIVFAVIMNFSESFFLASEGITALTVACAVGVTERSRREGMTAPRAILGLS